MTGDSGGTQALGEMEMIWSVDTKLHCIRIDIVWCDAIGKDDCRRWKGTKKFKKLEDLSFLSKKW